MTSLRSVLSLVGATIMGRLSDSPRIGRKACLYVGTGAAFISLVLGVTMDNLSGLWWSMVPAALLQQNFSILKAMLADYHDANTVKRGGDVSSTSLSISGSVGKLGMSLGLAIMVGPLTGSVFVKTFNGASYVGMFLVLVSAFFVSQIPDYSNSKIVLSSKDKEKSTSLIHKAARFIDVKSARSRPAIFLILIRVAMALAFHIFNTIWTVSLKSRFDFGPSDHGKFMSFIGLIYALSQGVLSKWILASVGRKGSVYVLQLCCVALGVGRYVAFQVESLLVVYIMFAFIVTALGVVNTILSADTSLIAPSSEIGGLYGVLMAAQSAAGMVGPLLGGSLAKIHPVNAPLGAVVCLYAFVFLMVLFGYKKNIYNCCTTESSDKQATAGKVNNEMQPTALNNLIKKEN